MSRLGVALAKRVFGLWPSAPPDPRAPGGLQEIFEHPRFREGTPEEREEIMRRSTRWKHDNENAYPWDHYFGFDLRPLLEGRTVLDLGCFNGGRTVAWARRYGVARISGVDVDASYIEAASRFAEENGIADESGFAEENGFAEESGFAEENGFAAGFRVGVAEKLPFDDASFDAVLSFDVFEHLQDPVVALRECRRVLRPGGRLFLVFPGYFHPNEHHLGLATRVPGLQYLFGGKTLVAAYKEILDSRGPDHAWYGRDSAELADWERGNTINGTTVRRFRSLLREEEWIVERVSRLPLFRVGRNVSRHALLRALGWCLSPLARLPLTEEAFLHRITYVLKRR